jgi:hypothetical protein
VLLLLLFSLAAHADDWRPLPANPRLPCKGKANGKELVVLADLDNNGSPDLARLQENKKTHRVRLAVWMNGSSTPVVLDDKEALKAGNFLRLQLPATRQALGADGKKAPLKIKFASLSYGACGVNEWVFQWNENKGKMVPAAVVPQ